MEVPAELIDKAKRIADIAFGEGSFGNVVDAIANSLLAERIAATERERERCAQIAEMNDAWPQEGAEIAAAIRS